MSAEDHDLPTRLGVKLAAVQAKAEAAQMHRATAEALRPDDYDADDDDLVTARTRGMEQVRAAMWRRVIPSRFQLASLTDFEGEPLAQLTEWAARPRGRNLLLLGPVGTGKSHAAVAAARVVFDRGQEVRFLPVVELLDLLRPGGPENALYDLADVELLVLDDLGSERPTDWTAERLYALINRRWLEEAPTVCTTNLSPKELEAALGARVYSRLVGSGSVGVALTGADRRRAR